MKNILFFAIFLALAVPSTAAMAQSGADHSKHGSPGQAPPSKNGHDHSTMEDMVVLGTVTADDIQAMAHLQALPEVAKRQPPATHIFMVAFEKKQGKTIAQGRAAVKVASPDGQTSKGVNMTFKGGFFSTELILKDPGQYTFLVGAKVLDGKARQFIFTHELK